MKNRSPSSDYERQQPLPLLTSLYPPVSDVTSSQMRSIQAGQIGDEVTSGWSVRLLAGRGTRLNNCRLFQRTASLRARPYDGQSLIRCPSFLVSSAVAKQRSRAIMSKTWHSCVTSLNSLGSRGQSPIGRLRVPLSARAADWIRRRSMTEYGRKDGRRQNQIRLSTC
jgi:hypothetical protein